MAFAAMLCWVGVNAQTITINYEQEGNGSPQVEYLNSSFMPTFVDLAQGTITITDAKYNPKNINGEWISCYQLIMHPNPAGKLLDIQRDGFTDTQAMSDARCSATIQTSTEWSNPSHCRRATTSSTSWHKTMEAIICAFIPRLQTDWTAPT